MNLFMEASWALIEITKTYINIRIHFVISRIAKMFLASLWRKS